MTISPELWRNLTGFLAFSLAIGIVAGLFLFEIPTNNEKVAYTVLGVAITWAGQVVGYHFGTSASSQKKTDIMAEKRF